MANVQVDDVLIRLRDLLLDADDVRWPLEEKLRYIADGVREVAFFKPDACAKTAVVQLVAGVRQTLPDDASSLLDVVRNMGTNRSTPGLAPRSVDRSALDAHVPGWHKSPPSQEVRHFMFDPQDQKVFLVWPPQPDTNPGSLELVYAAVPAAASVGASLPLDSVWLPALLNYVMYRCWSKDAEHAANAQLAVAYYQAFGAALQGRTAAEGATDVNLNRAPRA